MNMLVGDIAPVGRHSKDMLATEAQRMAEWRQLSMPGFCERMIGFSVPLNDTILVISYEGMHLLRLGPSVTVNTDLEYREYDLYDPDAGICRYLGKEWDIIGIHPGRPILSVRQDERLVLDIASETVSVVRADRVVWSSDYANFSGDWAAATFSPDGRFIVVGCPYDFDFRVFERQQEAPGEKTVPDAQHP